MDKPNLRGGFGRRAVLALLLTCGLMPSLAGPA
jgi:hypothetical protein